MNPNNQWDRDFDRRFDQVQRFAGVVGIIAGALSVAFVVTIIWAIVQLVQWVTR